MFGSLGHGGPGLRDEFIRFREGIEALYGQTAKLLMAEGVNTAFTGKGRLIGSACEGDSFLVLFGAVQAPLPGWGAGSPLDDPNRTARFLFQRYRERGLEFLDETIGAFVIGLWDADQQRFILANDPRGMRTAFYTETPNSFSFATTLYALNCVSTDGLEIDRSLEDFLLGYEFLPWQQTLYKGVFSLAPGSIIEWKDGVMRAHTSKTPDCSAYSLAELAGPDASEDEAGEILYELFMKSLQDVLPRDEKVAVLLGGFDSALIAAACRKLGKEVETYTFRFPESRFNQAFAEETAKLCGGKHHWIDITPEVIKEGLAEFPLIFNQPSSMAHYLIQTAFVLRKMQENGHNHCLTGDGCDEIFLGYPMVFKRATFFYGLNPRVNGMLGLARWFLQRRLVECAMGQPARFARNFMNLAMRPMPRRGHISNRILDERSLKYLRKRQPLQAMDSEAVLASLSLGLGELSPLKLAYHGKSMPALNRARNDGATSVSGLTILSPFQHPVIASFVQTLPETMLRKTNGCKGAELGKWLLLRVAETKKLLPNEIIYQKKNTPVAGMADYWYMDQLRAAVLGQIKLLPFQYETSYVNRLLEPKLFERVLRRKISLGSFILKAPPLLASYAAFNWRSHVR